MPEKPYKTGRALRQALERRPNAKVNNNAEVQRLRRLVSFDRLLARLFAAQESPWLVKGGYGLEVRYGMKARTTRDVDLALPSLTPEMVGALPVYPYSREWGYYPSGTLAVIVAVVAVVLLL